MNWKGFRRKHLWPEQGTTTAFTCRDQGKPRRTSVRILRDPAEIRTEDLPDMSPLQKLMVSQLVKDISIFYGSGMFVALSTRAHHLTLY
jgi:hypothetical protein